MNIANLEMLETAAEHLQDLPDKVVFVGGVTVELWITDRAAPEFRPTADVDVVVEIAAKRGYHQLEARVRALGFENSQESGVICRFRQVETGLVLDLMPTDPSILGFESRWLAESLNQATDVALPGGQRIQATPPPLLLATKLEAFRVRGGLDFYGSRDFEDIVRLIDGREELVGEISAAPDSLRAYIIDEVGALSAHPDFDNGLEGALPAGPEVRERVDLVIWPRVRKLMSY